MRLQVASIDERLRPNWEFLEERIGVPRRKLPTIVGRCPQLLVLSILGKLEPTVACLEAIGAQGKELATVVTRFPQILVHSVEEKLCPVLAFLESLGVKQENLSKVNQENLPAPNSPHVYNL
jgi:mTERF domain-containing protein